MVRGSNSSDSIALLGYLPEGHHLNHVLMLVDEGFNGYFIFTRAFFDALNEEVPDAVKLDRVRFIEVSSTTPWEVLKAIRRVVSNCSDIKEVFSTSIDEFWYPLLLLSMFHKPWINQKVRFSGIWIASNFFYKNPGNFKRRFVLRLLITVIKGAARSGSRILFFNEELLEFIETAIDNNRKTVSLCPDPFQKEGMIIRKDVAELSSPRLLMAGHHKPRKGTQWALESFLTWQGREIEILVVGKISGLPDLGTVISRLPDSIRVTIVDRRVSDEELSQYYNSCSAVLLPYRHFGGSSGIFVNALSFGKPVIASDWGVIGSRTKRLGAGLVFNHDSSRSFFGCIEKLIAEPQDFFNQSAVDAYLKENTPKKYAEAVFVGSKR